MPFKKANEAYFGDVFNRSTVACYNTEGNELMKGYVTGCDLARSPDSAMEATFSCIMPDNTITSLYSCNNSDSGVTIRSTVDDIQSELATLEARIVALESTIQPKKGADKLRSALRTLNRTREL